VKHSAQSSVGCRAPTSSRALRVGGNTPASAASGETADAFQAVRPPGLPPHHAPAVPAAERQASVLSGPLSTPTSAPHSGE
jgi:hypothetical protein